MEKDRKRDIERAKKTPAEEYRRPEDVTADPGLDRPDKRKILNQWEVDEQALSRASEEGMTGGEPSRLTEVQRERRKLPEEARRATRDRRTSGKPAR
jgi:hypothetical protein